MPTSVLVSVRVAAVRSREYGSGSVPLYLAMELRIKSVEGRADGLAGVCRAIRAVQLDGPMTDQCNRSGQIADQFIKASKDVRMSGCQGVKWN